MACRAAHQIGFLIVNESLHASAPGVFFGGRDRETLARWRTIGDRARKRGANERIERTAGDAFDRDAERDEPEVAVDHALAGRGEQRGAQRETFDVLVENRPVIGTRVHAGVVGEQHARGDRRVRPDLPLRQNRPERIVERQPILGDELQRERGDEQLRQRREVEAGVARDRTGQGVVARRAVGALEDDAAAVLDPRDRAGVLVAVAGAQRRVERGKRPSLESDSPACLADFNATGSLPVGMLLPKSTSARPPIDAASSP